MAIDINNLDDLTSRPLYVQSLDFSLSSGRFIEKVLASYTFPKGSEVPCGICGCRTPHMKGYLVLTTDMQETNIGNVCGKKHLGINFTEKRKQFKEAIRRSRNIEQVIEIKNGLSQYKDKISCIISRAKSLNRFKISMQKSNSALVRHLHQRAVSGHFDVGWTVRLSEAEAKKEFFHVSNRYETFEEYFRTRPTKRTVIATILGLEFFKYDLNNVVQHNIVKYWTLLNDLSIDQIDSVPTNLLTELTKWAGSLARQLETADFVLDKGESFFTTQNLKNMKYLSADNPTLQGLEELFNNLQKQLK